MTFRRLFSKPRRTRIVLVALAAAWSCNGCKSPDQEDPKEPTPTEHKSKIGARGINVVLVSVDTTRADHIGCYGHPKIKTPNIDRFAAEGTRFAWCISSAPLTLPSHTTMMTGSYPFLHGARDNGVFTVAPENVTLAEIFKEAGYGTHAEVAALVLNHKTGIDQGFDTFGDVEPAGKGKPKAKKVELESTSQPVIEPDAPIIAIERLAEDIFQHGIEVMKKKAATKEPFFMFLHCFDPHWPHQAPERFQSQYDDGYYAEIAYFDEQFGRFVDAVRELGIADKTLVILTSDHGEGRGQHSEWTHSTFLYDTTLHVPLIMWCPGQVPSGQVVECQVRLLDLAPTILELAKLGDRRTEQMQGTSLLPLLDDPALDLRLPCYSDTMVPKTSYGFSALRSIRLTEGKYILSPKPELFGYPNDYLELFNLAESDKDRADAMRQELYDLIADSPSPPGGRGVWRSMDDAERRKMEALGYISSNTVEDLDLTAGNEIDFFEPDGINPKDRIESIECMATGMGSIRVGQYEEGEKFFRRFCELEPDHPKGPSFLGRIFMYTDRDDEAIEQFRKCIGMRSDSYLERRLLGDLLAKKKLYAEAGESYRLAVKNNPSDYRSRISHGRVLAARQRFEDAFAEYDEAMKLVPEDPVPRLQKGLALLLAKRPEDAIPVLQEAARLDPNVPRPHAAIAKALRRLKRTDEAIEHLKETIESMPDAALLYHALAECYAVKSDPDNIEANFRRVVELLPDSDVARRNLGGHLLAKGQVDDALEQLQKAVELGPENVAANFKLARAFEMKERNAEAIQSYERVYELAPRNAIAYRFAANLMDVEGQQARAVSVLRKACEVMKGDAYLTNDLAWRLATSKKDEIRNGSEAVKLAKVAEGLTEGDDFNVLDTLAAAYAEVGRFDDAVETINRALAIAVRANDEREISSLRGRLELYEARRPLRR
ncbi:MAG: sulfatase-like hydrolase/transferase [Planctomycetota bacterium]|nr:sulfatase-like hydrolase/transferase [Planctomycetota bacterium]